MDFHVLIGIRDGTLLMMDTLWVLLALILILMDFIAFQMIREIHAIKILDLIAYKMADNTVMNNKLYNA